MQTRRKNPWLICLSILLTIVGCTLVALQLMSLIGIIERAFPFIIATGMLIGLAAMLNLCLYNVVKKQRLYQ
ncbi:hypothetical protein [Geomicrobium sediminis]|uniref:Lipoprotein n=1 Tax=Geomicrobium sediminis TaxID=1347788 RepID=A0ABS2PB40_9BACL|nr:hypothetical protein [Geomicrobium sediminis]MBM7632356.1 hypothetical protein [Geomicrobium sediminis]